MLIGNQKAFVESLIDAVYSQFIQDIQQANFLGVRNAFLFFAECTNLQVLHIFSFLSLLNVLIKQAEKAGKVVREELTYIILTVMPFVVRSP